MNLGVLQNANPMELDASGNIRRPVSGKSGISVSTNRYANNIAQANVRASQNAANQSKYEQFREDDEEDD